MSGSNQRSIKLISIFFYFLFVLSSCQFTNKGYEKESVGFHEFEAKKNLYEKALNYFESAQYEKSKKILEALQYEVRLKSFKLLVLYNLGRVYEALNQCKKAEMKYRDLIHFSLGEFRTLRAKGVLRLGYVYECLNEDSKVIGSFLDVRREKKVLSDFTTQVEAALRLALAYARLNHWKAANHFFESSKGAFQKFSMDFSKFYKGHQKKEGSFEEKENWAQKFYLIGNLNKSFYNIQNLELKIKSLNYMQKYLIEIFKIQSLTWSRKALEEIKEVYKKLWIEVQNLKSTHKGDQRKLSFLIMQNLHQLKMSLSFQMESKDFRFVTKKPNWFQRVFLNQDQFRWSQVKRNLLSFAVHQELQWVLSSDKVDFLD